MTYLPPSTDGLVFGADVAVGDRVKTWEPQQQKMLIATVTAVDRYDDRLCFVDLRLDAPHRMWDEEKSREAREHLRDDGKNWRQPVPTKSVRELKTVLTHVAKITSTHSK